jgi:hypothetical protein
MLGRVGRARSSWLRELMPSLVNTLWRWYSTVRELMKSRVIVKLANSWVIMNPAGPPSPDKPDISVVDYEAGNTVSSFMNLRVADIQAC